MDKNRIGLTNSVMENQEHTIFAEKEVSLLGGHRYFPHYRTFISNAIKIMASNYSVLALGIISSIIINRNLSYSERASFTLIITVQSIFVLIVSFGLPNSLNYVTINLSDGSKRAALAFTALLTSILLIILSILIYVLFWAFVSDLYKNYFLVLGAMVYLQVAFLLHQCYSLACCDYSAYSKTQVENRAVSIIAVIIAFLFLKFDLTNLLFSLVASQAIFIILLYTRIDFRKASISSLYRQELRELVCVGARGMLAGLLGMLIRRVDVFIVGHFLGETKLALYAVALFVYNLVETMSGSAGLLLANKSAMAEKDLSVMTWKISRYAIVVVSFVMIIFYLVGERMIVLLYTEKYAYSYNIFIYLIPSLLVYTFVSGFANVLAGKGYSKQYLLAHLYCLIFSFVSQYILTRYYGIGGTALSLFMSAVLIGVLLIMQFKKSVVAQGQSNLESEMGE